MRSGAAQGHRGYFHETALYDSDSSFVDIVAPFVHDGIAAGEPTVVACGDRNTRLLREAVDCSAVVFMPGADQYARPAPTIKSYRHMFRQYTDAGVGQIRVVGDVPHPGLGTDWTAWMHYEAAVNVAYDDFPIWGLCPYDRRTAPAEVLDDVCCAHPFIATSDGRHQPNDHYEAPHAFLGRRPDPLPELGEPVWSLTMPSPGEARRAVAGIAASLDATALEHLRLVTSELVTNAVEHGRAPTELTLWVGDSSVTVAVHDSGTGPTDPLAGWLEPDRLKSGGRGLWIVNQVATDLRISREDGFEVRATIARHD